MTIAAAVQYSTGRYTSANAFFWPLAAISHYLLSSLTLLGCLFVNIILSIFPFMFLFLKYSITFIFPWWFIAKTVISAFSVAHAQITKILFFYETSRKYCIIFSQLAQIYHFYYKAHLLVYCILLLYLMSNSDCFASRANFIILFYSTRPLMNRALSICHVSV